MKNFHYFHIVSLDCIFYCHILKSLLKNLKLILQWHGYFITTIHHLLIEHKARLISLIYFLSYFLFKYFNQQNFDENYLESDWH